MIFTEADKGGAAGISPTEVFEQARVAEGLDQPPAPSVEEPPAAPPKPADPPPAEPEPPKKGAVPADVIDPSTPPAPKVHDAVAEIQAAELPKGAKKEQIDSFGKLKTKAAGHLQAALDRAAELEAKIEKGDSSKAELETLRTQLSEATDRASQIEERWSKEAFASSPKFQAQFTGREQTALELAKTYLDGTEIKADIIDLAAHATGRKRVEILKDAGVDDSVIQLISPHLANYDTIQREKQNALANWKTQSAQEREADAQRNQQAQQKRSEAENKVWENVVTNIDLLPLRKSKENPEWNTRAEDLRNRAKEIFNGAGADLPTFGETILKGVAYDVQQEVVEHLRGEVSALRTENARLKSAAPGGSITVGTGDGALVDTSKMSRNDQAKSTFNAEKAKAAAA